MGRVAATAFIVLVLAFGTIEAAEIYRWTDDAGRVHYDDNVPDAQKHAARPIAVNHPPEAERVAAEARLAREKSAVEAMRRKREEAATKPNVASLPAVKGTPPPVKLTCAQEWERFNQSGACYAPYHTKFGIKAEAGAHCGTPVLVPTCPNPYHPSSERR